MKMPPAAQDAAPPPAGAETGNRSRRAAPEQRSDRQFAATLARGLDLLACFTPDQPLLGNADLARRTGLPKATVSRFTYTLSKLGYLHTHPKHGKYALAPAVLSLSYPLLASVTTRQWLRPAMRDLSEASGGSVSLGIRDRLRIVYVETSRSPSVFAHHLSDVGMGHPLIAAAIGRAYLAACDQGERTALFNQVRLQTPELWTRHERAARASLDFFGRHGFTMSRGDVRPDVHAVGVPLGRAAGGDIMAMNCVLHTSQLRPDVLEKEIGPRLAALARSVPPVPLDTGRARGPFGREERP